MYSKRRSILNNSLKRNDQCSIGLPSCGYVFDSMRSCFIAYGFNTSPLERDIIIDILTNNGIEVFEAGKTTTPGKSAFCTKICSRIITSSFCIVLLNHDTKESTEIPNANVYMEYGLMLGFNKYTIPFQKESSALPFNVAGLDTVKYKDNEFKVKAEETIKLAIAETQPENTSIVPIDKVVDVFLISHDMLMSPIVDDGTKNIYLLGSPLGFNLLNDFAGFRYVYFGMFNLYNTDLIKWRVVKLDRILKARFGTLHVKKEIGMISIEQIPVFEQIRDSIEIWIVVQNDSIKGSLLELSTTLSKKLVIFTLNEIEEHIKEIGI